MILLSLSNRSKKWFPLSSEAWNDIFQYLMMSSLLFFLLKSHEFLHGNSGIRLKDLVSLSTLSWRTHLRWLGHSQNLMELLSLLLKKSRRSERIAADVVWKGWLEESKIFQAMWMESVMMTIFEILSKQLDWLMPHLMANNLASVLITLTAWWIVFVKGLSAIWMCTMEVATLFLMLASEATRATKGDEENSKVNSSSS